MTAVPSLSNFCNDSNDISPLHKHSPPPPPPPRAHFISSNEGAHTCICHAGRRGVGA